MVIKEMPTDIASIEEIGMYDNPGAVGWLGWLRYKTSNGGAKLGFIDLNGVYIHWDDSSPIEITVKYSNGKLLTCTVYHDPFGKKQWKQLRKQLIAEMEGKV